MVDANSAIFAELDNFCSRRGEPLLNAGAPRWIASGRTDRNFLQRARLGERIYFSPTRKLSTFIFENVQYYVSTGFEAPASLPQLVELPTSGGLLTLAISELSVRPKSTPTQIRQIVEVSDLQSDPSYSGHDSEQISSLFPAVKFLRDDFSTSVWNTFFRFALAECRYQGGWMDEDLLDILEEVANLDENRIPYKVLCRSVFDLDPSSFYLAIYRCLEALFSYYSSISLRSALRIDNDWLEIAGTLENALGWRPHELGGLEGILRFAVVSDLRDIMIAMRVTDIPITNEDIIKRASKEIYKLRNSVVHYRAGTRDFDFAGTNWNLICKFLSMIVLHVYGEMA